MLKPFDLQGLFIFLCIKVALVTDPCCGTGTLLIEAAFLAAHRAPGVARPFAMEDFYFCRSLPFSSLRRQVAGEQRNEDIPYIGGSDLDPQAILLASRHVKQAELSNHIHLSVQPLQSLQLPITGGVFLCNPPYGERLSDQASCRKLYRELCLLKDRHPSWSLCAISSDPSFERFFGRRADKKRRLYNGRLECTDYIYL